MKKTVSIAGVPIDNLSYDEVLEAIEDVMSGGKPVYLVTTNPEMIVNSVQDESFLNVLKGAELRTADGIGMLWAAYFLSLPKARTGIGQRLQLVSSLLKIVFAPKKIRKALKERVTGADLFPRIIEKSQEKEWRLFLLGASDGVAEKTMHHFSSVYKNAVFCGSHAGTPSVDDEAVICHKINHAKPTILFVAYGSPAQEFWIHRNLSKLISVKLAIGVGGTFDFYAGKSKRAPRWMQKLGLEWLWRFAHEPRRASRMKNATLRFIRLVYGLKRAGD